MEEIDVWRSAQQFMKMQGADAAVVAATLVDARLADGDMDGVRICDMLATASSGPFPVIWNRSESRRQRPHALGTKMLAFWKAKGT